MAFMATKYIADLLIWPIHTTAFTSSKLATSDFFIRMLAQPAEEHTAYSGTQPLAACPMANSYVALPACIDILPEWDIFSCLPDSSPLTNGSNTTQTP